MRSPGLSLADYVDGLQGAGRYTFTARKHGKQLAQAGHSPEGGTAPGVGATSLFSPRRVLVTVPLEYQSAGAPPRAGLSTT